MKAVFEIEEAKGSAPVTRDVSLFTLLFFAVFTVITAPLTVIDIPLLADYPNHLARMHILGNVDNDFFLGDRYAIDLGLIPNIAMDITVPLIARWLPLDLAARIFLAVCLMSTLASVAWLHRTLFNQWSSYSLLAALFAYHGSMLAGMVNFSLGIGLVPAAVAVWIRMQHAPTSWRLLVGVMMTLGLYFCHLVAVGAFGLVLLGWALAHMRDHPMRATSAITTAGVLGVLPAVLFLRVILGAEDQLGSAEIVYGNIAWKLKALLAPLANYNLALDLFSFALIAGLGLILWLTGWLTIDRRMAPGLALLALAFVLAPKALWTGGVFDQRLAVLLAFMLVACSRVRRSGKQFHRFLLALLVLLFVVRTAALTSAWLDHRGDLAEMRQAIDLVTPGARILVARPDKETGQRLAPARHRVFHHAVQLTSLPALAVIEKSAFVSTLYALPGQQPLVLKAPFDRLGGRGHVDLPTLGELSLAYRPLGGELGIKPQIRDWTTDFDYVVLIHGYGPGADALAGDLPLEPLLDGDILDLFRIVKASAQFGFSAFPAKGCWPGRPCQG